MASRKPRSAMSSRNGRANDRTGSSSSRSSRAGPRCRPIADTVTPEPSAALMPSRIDNSSGACRMTSWSTANTLCACAPSHSSRKVEASATGEAWKVNEVLMPKLPPPPPRQAQNRSGFRWASQVSSCPSAVTRVVLTRASAVSPSLREVAAEPPPRASPAMPTDAPLPSANAIPCGAIAA